MRLLPLLWLASLLASALGADPIGPGELSAVLATVYDNDAALSSTPSVYTVTLNADLPSLTPDTYYWIGLCDVTDSPCSYSGTATSARWYFDQDGLGLGVAGNDFEVGGPPEISDEMGPSQMSVAVGGSPVFDNTSDTTGYNSASCPDYTCYDQVGQPVGPLYDSFYTGAATGQITNLELILSVPSASDGGSFQVGLFADETPEPASALLIAAGLGFAAMFRRRAASRRV